MRSLITNIPEKCVGCNRCIRVCPIDEANITREVDGKIIVEADNSKCISCGACLTACHHGARRYIDDTERFIEDLKSGVPISMLAAPAIKSNFDDWGRLFSWLKQMGVKKIYDVSLGADICSWAHIRYIQKNKRRSIISQPCPAIVNYILMYRNELIKHLSPIHSPMLCTAVFMDKYERVKDKIAALSPCVAKAHEFEATNLVEYNVTFNRLFEYIESNNIVFPEQESGFDNYEAGLGSLYPMPGGLKENIEYYLGKSIRVDKSEGPQVVYKALDEYAKQSEEKLPVLFDVLNCPEGCNIGTGCQEDGVGIFDINTKMDMLRQTAINEDKKEYLDELYERFDKELKLDDFIRKYVPQPVRLIPLKSDKVEEAFKALDKFTISERTFDCGACGCNTCHEMAERIAKGLNTPSNCLEKAHKDVVRDHEDAKANLGYVDMVMADVSNIKEMTEDIIQKIKDINSAITAYNTMVADIEKISMSVNIIALNASIEAARAGQSGKVFGVVADEIRTLAQNSDDSAKKTKETSEIAALAIESINHLIADISTSVNEAYTNLSSISTNTKKILTD